MERQQLITISIALIIGIIVGVGLGFALWHGVAPATCQVPLNS